MLPQSASVAKTRHIQSETLVEGFFLPSCRRTRTGCREGLRSGSHSLESPQPGDTGWYWLLEETVARGGCPGTLWLRGAIACCFAALRYVLAGLLC
jgi:hypothetical protein